MTGLIKKDLLMIKNNTKRILIFIPIFIIIALQGKDALYFMPVFIGTMLFITTFSYDDYNKWDAYAITLPNGRKNVVKSKYLANLILILMFVLLTYALAIVTGIVNKNLNINDMNSAIMSYTFAVILIQVIMNPLIFKWGLEKGRIGLFIIVLAVGSISGIFLNNIKISISKELITLFNNYYMLIIPTITIILLLISYKISDRIYSNKEY